MNDIMRSSTRSDRPGTSDPEEFQLPLPGLYGDLELGRGSVQLDDEFQHCASLVKLQLLRDWQRSLAATGIRRSPSSPKSSQAGCRSWRRASAWRFCARPAPTCASRCPRVSTL